MKLFYPIIYSLLTVLAYTAHAQAPVEFVENKGQWGDWFRYKAEARGGDVLLENDGFRFVLADRRNNQQLDSFHHGLRKDNPLLKFHVYKVTFEGCKQPDFKGLKPQQTYYNYFLGNDPAKWHAKIHPNFGVDYQGIYKDIDLHVTSESGQVVYEFMVQPNAAADDISLRFEGQDDIRLKKGNLVISTSVGEVTEMKPYAYQYINDQRKQVACDYVLKENKLTFDFPDGYDHSQLLIIDPTIVFSTFTGSTADNWGFTATYDNAGNFYAGGLVNNLAYGGGFPVSTGAFQTTWGGGSTVISGGMVLGYAADISIIKYNSTGSSRMFATYLGGAGNEHVHSMIVDDNGNLVMAGRTLSQNFPLTASAYQNTNHGGWDMIVTSMAGDGSALIGSTYIGGSGEDCVNFDSTEYFYGELKHNYGDESRSEVQVDHSGNIYVAGCTNSTNFPTTPTAVSSSLQGVQDGIVFKFNSLCSNLIWSTYLGGNASDAAYVLAFDSLQQFVYVAGGTNSSNFTTTPGCWQTSPQGDADGFVTKFLNSGAYSIQRSSYIGTSGYDQVYGIQIYPTNEVYLMGQSIGGLFPVTAGVYSNPNSSQFIMKMDRNLTSDLISTVYGSGDPTLTNISPVAFLVDTCSNVYISGWGGNLGLTGTPGGTAGMPTTTGAVTDGADFYFIVLGPGMTFLRYATFYGRNCSAAGYGEHVDGGTSRFDKNGIIYQAICANCGGAAVPLGCSGPFPTTAGAWAEVNGSIQNCNQAALKIAFEIGPVQANVTASPSTSGCAPLTVTFTNSSNNGLSFVWDFGDGSPVETTFSATHTFTAAGTYTVTLAASNTNACFTTDDTAYLVIVVDTNQVDAAFDYVINDSCGPYTATFTNTSQYGSTPGASAFTIFRWSFGDASSSYTGTTPPTHSYPGTGTYTVTLVMIDTTACNSPDTMTKVLTFNSINVSAQFDIPDTVCLGAAVSPVTNATNGVTYSWVFGDGQTSTSATPTVTFTTVGTYVVTFIVANPNSCNGADTFTHSITVVDAPTAAFTFVPITPEANVPTTFTNLSANATRYTWDFGDNSTSTEVNPIHQYSITGTYNACLTAYNSSNCPAKVCQKVSAEVVPLIGVPSGFTPNGDGENDVLFVRGAAIKTLNLKIYNRWGQLVFETSSKEKGWDGTFNGQPQPIEAYGFVLLASFIDGTSKTLKGNITLLR